VGKEESIPYATMKVLALVGKSVFSFGGLAITRDQEIKPETRHSYFVKYDRNQRIEGGEEGEENSAVGSRNEKQQRFVREKLTIASGRLPRCQRGN